MFKKYITLIIFVSLLFVSTNGVAQIPGDCDDDPDSELPPCPPANPIDGGVAILLAAGVAYGIKKLRE